MSFARKEAHENVTAGFAFPKPSRAVKEPKRLVARQPAPGEPPKFSTLSRGKPMRKGPPKRIAARVADRPYVAWIHTQACCVTFSFAGPGVIIEANHAGPSAGMAAKCSDLETLPVEREAHRQWTEYSGRFKSWTRAQRREWADARIVEHLDRFIAWAPERLTDLDEEIGTYAGGSEDELEIAAGLTAERDALRACRERAIERRAEVVSRIGAVA